MGFYDWDKMEPQEINGLYLRKVVHGQNVAVAKVEVKQGAITQPHSHSNEELVVVLKGVWQFHLPSGDVTLRENQVLSIPPGVQHSSEALEDLVALDICTPTRLDWKTGEDRKFHDDPDQYLWAV
jgi:quercetin dioxygenase-like cupin family protein